MPRNSEEEVYEEKPDFLPMFPWYSGTSADMYHTMFDLLISLKLFLGRYDMRQMQAFFFPSCFRQSYVMHGDTKAELTCFECKEVSDSKCVYEVSVT